VEIQDEMANSTLVMAHLRSSEPTSYLKNAKRSEKKKSDKLLNLMLAMSKSRYLPILC
jgi:hypothetical protein